MAIAFWSVENVELSEILLALADRYREEIISELTARYKESVGVEQGTIRIGQLYRLLQGIKKCEMNMKWEYEVYRMLNVFDEKTFMYSMQLHRADIELHRADNIIFRPLFLVIILIEQARNPPPPPFVRLRVIP
ncbi:hypothetical protein PENTCL1PPCAC_14536 [Pristionchus entomophagus]|uniref:Uncharacterized protein n=1 Tax=Pristionchus entomophagus TaxID=358040 RepID=A0AAV5TGN8_9BILA|nr:hypothetical protein PENTCL1PPCAC_14536 [Pristionchus entomophagus]